ncbi:MAG: sigma-70 family RNA polymerase sigma factor [Lentisphaeraceae bacterium]|nr:sigma-70 family RNA polymerase sigma factor [Lentisphaeraceae bacterium]
MKAEELTAILLPERRSLIAYFAVVTQDYHLAEDIFQEVCIKAVGSLDKFKTPKHAIHWSKMVGRNRAIDKLRARGEKYVGLTDEMLEVLAAEWPTSKQSDRLHKALGNCIKKTTPNNQELLRLRYFERLPGAKVAESLGKKLDTVYQALARIHKALGTCVKTELSSEGLK